MIPSQHVQWLIENTTWFENLPASQLETKVPSCPGWVVEDVINHLSFGVGLAYPLAVASSPNIRPDRVFANIDKPDVNPTGRAAVTTFATNMRSCIENFSATDPKTPCWTYAGAGNASFWFRRAAIETALHRIDVEEALPGNHPPLSDDRTADAISEAIEFALPLAVKTAGQPAGCLAVSSPELGIELELGKGPKHVLVEGAGQDVLLSLWGRNRHRVTVSGDQKVAADWLSLVERAFAGR